jgi:WXG100 family type VII secretion target
MKAARPPDKEHDMTGSSGGAGNLKVGAGVLQSAAKEITSAQDDLTTYAANLEKQLAPMAAKWKGAGATAFFEFFNSWHEKEKKIVDILTNFSNSLGATHTTTDEVDRHEQANYQKMVGRLG